GGGAVVRRTSDGAAAAGVGRRYADARGREHAGDAPPGPAEAEDQRVTRQLHQRSFRVESASRAHTTDTIQKRTMICGSGHPSSSKWWWMGAIRKMRLRR